VQFDFQRAPFLVIWEVTRACALACVHCRADAIARRDPRELSTEEGHRMSDQVAAFGTPPPLFVLTGGDPMWRKDLTELVGHAARAGLTVALTPSGTAMATRGRLQELKAAGLSRVAVSLDGPDPESHDAFRRVRGSYANRFPLTLWAVFFLVQTGRGASLEQITAAECEEVLEFLDALAQQAPFGIKTTEAPHYRRVQSRRAEPRPGPGRRQLRAPRAVNDGNGFVMEATA
jgi:AdoMet-dependent heme synthase